MAIQWKESMAIGIREIDKQHQELVNKMNNLLSACNQGKGKEEVGNIIKFLGEYVVTHFRDEEKIQQKFGYPKYEAHKALHTKFIEDFTMLKKEFDSEGPTINFVMKVNHTLVDWLIEHINREDRAIGAFINKNK